MTPRIPTTTSALRLRALRLAAAAVWAHGNMTPQAVDTSTLPQLGAEWRTENPYRQNAEAIRIGSAAYTQNCARCHGLEAVSGGMAPDLRRLNVFCRQLKDSARQARCMQDVDSYFMMAVNTGKIRAGIVYMPPWRDVLTAQEIWAARSFVESRPPATPRLKTSVDIDHAAQ